MEINDIEILKVEVSEDNIENMIFKDLAGKYCVRLYDIDAKEQITLVKCKTLELAEKYFKKFHQV